MEDKGLVKLREKNVFILFINLTNGSATLFLDYIIFQRTTGSKSSLINVNYPGVVGKVGGSWK